MFLFNFNHVDNFHVTDENHYSDVIINAMVLIHQRLECSLNRLFRRRSKKTPKLGVIGLCEGDSPATGEFPAQRASNAKKDSIWWRHHVLMIYNPWWHKWTTKQQTIRCLWRLTHYRLYEWVPLFIKSWLLITLRVIQVFEGTYLKYANFVYQPVRSISQWRHNERDGVSNHRRNDCLLNHLFRRRSKKTSKLRVTGLCEGNSQRASNAGNVSIWWRHSCYINRQKPEVDKFNFCRERCMRATCQRNGGNVWSRHAARM